MVNNYDLTEILQSSEVWGTIKPFCGGIAPDPNCQKFYTASAPLTSVTYSATDAYIMLYSWEAWWSVNHFQSILNFDD